MILRDYFPLGKAYGDAFCNRTEETERLTGNLLAGKHTFLVAPRRYGKSSLAEKAIQQSGLNWSKVDFHIAVKDKDIENLILTGVIDLIGKSISHVDKMAAQLKKLLKGLKPKFSIGLESLKLELEAETGSTPAENIAEAILLLETLLREKNKRAIILFDEFQEVGQIAKGRGVEGAIRHAAQETRNLAIIFSGSNPHLLRLMFEHDRRPLYKLCKKMVLTRISEEHYKQHLNHIAKQAWQRALDEDVFQEIIHLTERHPYYMNLLCDEIWSKIADLPKISDVRKAWELTIDGERSDLIKDFLNLSHNQRIVMMHIAKHGGHALKSGEALQKMGLALGSLSSALLALEERDFLEKHNGEYRIIIPAYKEILREA